MAAKVRKEADRTTQLARRVRDLCKEQNVKFHHAVLDDHLTKLYAAAESQLQGYVAALAEPPSRSGAPERREEDGKRTPMCELRVCKQ